MTDTWNPAKLNEKISGRDSWNQAILNEAVTDRDSWNPAILNESAGETPVVFEATITASFPEGATCTATNGTTTLTADDNPMAFSIPNEGTWTVACVANGVTFSEDVVIDTDGQTETIYLTPVGETYATTDSVPVLIACAGIGDSEITTISGALADLETLTAILESENAIDYLVRSTTFASDVTADSGAMTLIGGNNYCANTLLGNSTWLNAICNSTYFESVLNAKVPVMTSDTTPSGEVITSSNISGFEGYKAFDENTSNSWRVNSNVLNGSYIIYHFTSQVRVNKVVNNYRTGSSSVVKFTDWELYGSNDNVSYTDIGEINANGDGANVTNILSNSNKYSYYKLVCKSASASGTNYGFAILQFYGRQDV